MNAKHIRFFFLSMFAFLLTSCGDDKLSENVRRLNDIVENIDLDKGASFPVDAEWAVPLWDLDGINIVYFVDSGCSACIGDYSDFIRIVDRIPSIGRLYCVINENHRNIVDYYIDCMGIELDAGKVLSYVEVNDYYPYGMSDGRNVLLISGNRIISSFRFVGGTVINR